MTNSRQHPAATTRSLASLVAVVIFSLTLSGCETPGLGSISGSGERRAERLADNDRHDDAAAEYIFLASSATGSERDRLTQLAIEQWLDAGDTVRARNAFDSAARNQADTSAPIWKTNFAAFALYRGEADEALGVLEPLSREPLSRRDRLRVEALRADAWIQKQAPGRAVEVMMQRESWIDRSSAIEKSRYRLWQGLLVSDRQILQQDAAISASEQTREWLTLGALAVSTGQQGIGWSNGVADWQSRNPTHPAITILGRMQIPDPEQLDYPRHIALLLPLSGRSAAAGRAVQNGFLGSYFASSGALDERQTVRVYDVNKAGGASAAYQTAVLDGAEFVVGPLLKSSVTRMASDLVAPVPVLTLNYLPDDSTAPNSLYQFALAPEDEAASAAQRALGDGHKRAVALVPNNDWGKRVLQSFATEFEGLGGTLLDYRSYSPGERDFSSEIEILMGLTGSVNRYQRMRNQIGGNLQFDPRRRQDVEFIFLATAAGPGRLLKSQLKFHYSGDLPVYSTSLVNSLDGRSDSDLNGIMFADVPWLINPQPWIQYLPTAYTEYWPTERRLGRLHAMGFDAYNLVTPLYTSRDHSSIELDGATGELFMDYAGRIHRRLPWAQFQNAEVVALPDQDATGGPILDGSDDGERLAPDAADFAPWDRQTP